VKRARERGRPEARAVVLGHAPLFRPKAAVSTRIHRRAKQTARPAAA
jgi:hypothetical protein